MPQHVTVKQYLVLTSAWLDLRAEAVADGGVKCGHCGSPIRVAAVEMSFLIEDTVDEGAELSQVRSIPLPGCPACEDSSEKTRIVEAAAADELYLQSWAWIGLPSSTIRSEAA